MPELIANYRDIRSSIVELLESSRRHAARSVNALMTATYWQIGARQQRSAASDNVAES